MSRIKQLLAQLDSKEKLTIQYRRNHGQGFNIISQPFQKAKLVYDPINKFSVKIELEKPGRFVFSAEAAMQLSAELNKVSNIALELNASINL